MSKQQFPPGWDEKRVNELIAHYENQTEDDYAPQKTGAGDSIQPFIIRH